MRKESQQGRRRWKSSEQVAHRVTLCPVSIRSAGTRTPSGAPISSPKRTKRGRTAPRSARKVGRPRPKISTPERPPDTPPAAPDSITPPEAVKKSGSKNPRHVTIVSHVIIVTACHYCTETERHTACHYCGGIYAHMSETARNASCHFCAEPPTQKKQATCGASYKRSVQ